MDFALDEPAAVVARIAGDLLDSVSTRSGPDPSDQIWKAFAQAGVLALTLPEELGGDGLGVMETMALLTEVGRRAVAVPALATLALGVLPIVRWGRPELRETLLPPVAAGELLLSAAWRASGSTWLGVAYAEQAHRLLVPIAGRIAVVDPHAPGVTLRRSHTACGAPEYTVHIELPSGEVDRPLATDYLDGGGQAVADLRRLAVASACALADGALAGALDLTVAHIGRRHQFGKPLATFQAAAQRIADVAIAARAFHLATTSACWRLATGRDADDDLAVAAYWLVHEVPGALRSCHHLHGGLGVDASYPLHRYSSLIRDLVRGVS